VFKLVDEVIKAQASLGMKPGINARIKINVTQRLEDLYRVCGKLWIGSGLPLVQLPLSNAKGLGL